MSLPRADEWTDPGPMDPPPRRGRKAIAGLALLAIAAVGSILLWRATSLRAIPEAGEPFDTKAFGTVDLPDDWNAFTYYRQAAAKFRDDPSLGGPYFSWAHASQRDREWLYANSEAMELWYVGTTMDRAVYIQPRDLRIDSPLDLVQTLRRMSRLAQLVGLRMEAQGDLDEAWGWYRAGLRCSRHCGKNGGFIDRLIGLSMYSQMEKRIRAWAEHPNQSASSLRRALDEVVAIDDMTPSFAENLRSEYFAFSHFLDAPDISLAKIELQIIESKSRPDISPFASVKETLWRLVLRETERSRRLIRVVWANWLAAAGLPPGQRLARGHRLRYGYFYDPPPDAPESVRRLTPERIDGWVGSTRYLRAMLPGIDNFDKAEANEAAMRAPSSFTWLNSFIPARTGIRRLRRTNSSGPISRASPRAMFCRQRQSEQRLQPPEHGGDVRPLQPAEYRQAEQIGDGPERDGQ